jgi:hypothetical protein
VQCSGAEGLARCQCRLEGRKFSAMAFGMWWSELRPPGGGEKSDGDGVQVFCPNPLSVSCGLWVYLAVQISATSRRSRFARYAAVRTHQECGLPITIAKYHHGSEGTRSFSTWFQWFPTERLTP